MKVNILVLVKSVLKYFEVMEQGVCNFQKNSETKDLYICIFIYTERKKKKRERSRKGRKE